MDELNLQLPYKKISGRSGNVKPKKAIRNILTFLHAQVKMNGYMPFSSRDLDDTTIAVRRDSLTENTQKIDLKMEYI